MAQYKKYSELSIHEKINYKSGWDIAIAHEGEIRKDGKRYCKMQKCLDNLINTNICQRDYNGEQRHRFLQGGRTLYNKQKFSRL